MGKALNGKPYAGNPHVRFDEGEVASAATPRRGSLLYTNTLSFFATAKDIWTTSNGNASTARVKARKLVLSGNYNASLGTEGAANITSTCDWYLGEDGMNVTGSQHFFMHHAGDVLRIHPWKCDTAINQASGSATATTLQMNKTGSLEFYTDDEDGVARTITLNGIISSNAPSTLKGAGTLALKKSQRLGAGLSVDGTATLKVAQSGTIALRGNLTLADGATLGFNFTEKGTAPVLDLTDKTVTAAGTVNVKISSDGEIHPRGGRHVLTSGGVFAGVTVSRGEGAPKWVKGVSVVDGEIVLEVIPKGCIIIVK